MLWSLKHFGADAYGRVIDRMHGLALVMRRRIDEHPDFELVAPGVFNCVCFRRDMLDDAGSRRVLKQLVDSGDALLGPASVKGHTGLRACLMNLRTTEADVDFIIERLATLAAQP